MSPEQYVQRLTEISHKKHKYMQDMYMLTVEQSKTINEDGLEQLDKIIAARQTLIEQVDKLDEEFSVYFQRLKQVLGVKSLDEIKSPGIPGVKELQQSIKAVMGLIKDITELDKQNNNKAKKLLDELGNEIRKINQGKRVNMAYNPSPVMQPPSYFIDKKK
ncbi:MAG: flagellar protein FlgN [Clostridia bacterium]|nr:flagellar protein FlgN [Clostridia bacterium]